jgi:hypothetical protein
MQELKYDSGTAVQVRERFLGRWHSGFAVYAHDEDGIRIVRVTDGAVLPVLFSPDEVRPAR